jgi:hypothetical protein
MSDLVHADPLPAEQQNGQLTAVPTLNKISAERYEAAVGHAPQDDDLDRANCSMAGQVGHTQCGWDDERDLPEFIAVAHRLKEDIDARAGRASPNDEGKAPE